MMIPEGSTISILNIGMTEEDIHRTFAEGGQEAIDDLPWVRLHKDMSSEKTDTGGVPKA